MDQPGQPMLIKGYAGHRLYRPATGAYLTRDDLMTPGESGENFVVIDADSGNEVTASYRPIIVQLRTIIAEH
jgi:polyhydroxyalkanoate synthesis regulator protein